MKKFYGVYVVAALSIALFSATSGQAIAETYSITQNFETANDGDLVQPLFNSIPITVSYAGFVVDTWEPDLSDPQLAVGSSFENRVIAGQDGPIIFQLGPDIAYDSFSIDVVPLVSASPGSEPAAASYFLQTISGSITSQSFDPTIFSTISLTGLIDSGYNAIILPAGTQYDNVSIQAVTIPEGDTGLLLGTGILALIGVAIRRRRS